MAGQRFGLLLMKDQRASLAPLLERYHRLLGVIGRTHVPAPSPGEPQPTGRGHMQTRLENDRVWTTYGLPPRDVSDAIRYFWPQDVWTDAARVSHQESGWGNTAERNTLGQAGGRCNVPIGYLADGTPIVSEQSIGIFQINRCAHGGTADHWKNADHNAQKGAELYRREGWRPWIVTARRLGLI